MSVSKVLGKPRENKLFVPDPRWVLPTTLLGLEYEYEGVHDRNLPHHTHASLWQYHEEGSLRDAGAEFVFRQPLFGKDAHNAIDWLMELAVENKWRCTMRTGIHVHIDVRDIEVPQLVGLALLYACVEPIIYHWIGDNRENSHFCVPLYKADEALLAASGILNAALKDDKNDTHSAGEAAATFERYAGLNFQALEKFGSLEFRHMRTTHDKARVFNWVNIIMGLKEASFRVPTSDGAIVRMAERMGAHELLYYIFGPVYGEMLYTEYSQAQLHEYGIPAARDLALHGCAPDSWGQIVYPKGHNSGFAKFLGSKEQPKESKVVDAGRGEVPVIFGDVDDEDDGEPVRVPDPAPRRMRFNPNQWDAMMAPQNFGAVGAVMNEAVQAAPAQPLPVEEDRAQVQARIARQLQAMQDRERAMARPGRPPPGLNRGPVRRAPRPR